MTNAADSVATFNQHRPLLFAIAYRMLGSVMDAEDMVQETFLRWQRALDEEVRSPKSYLSTLVTRLCIDHLRSARSRREQYIGPWLPEPLIAEDNAELEESVAMADSLSIAFLVLLESLSPVERAVFLLREVFDYEYAEVARIVEKSDANCRQMVRRAKQRIREGRPRFDASREQAQELMARFIQAARTGDMDGLLALLAEDVTLWSDGGGKVAAALNPIYGAEKVARLAIALGQRLYVSASMTFKQVNGQPGVVVYDAGGQPVNVLTMEVADGRITALRSVVNPEKLRNVPARS